MLISEEGLWLQMDGCSVQHGSFQRKTGRFGSRPDAVLVRGGEKRAPKESISQRVTTILASSLCLQQRTLLFLAVLEPDAD